MLEQDLRDVPHKPGRTQAVVDAENVMLLRVNELFDSGWLNVAHPDEVAHNWVAASTNGELLTLMQESMATSPEEAQEYVLSAVREHVGSGKAKSWSEVAPAAAPLTLTDPFQEAVLFEQPKRHGPDSYSESLATGAIVKERVERLVTSGNLKPNIGHEVQYMWQLSMSREQAAELVRFVLAKEPDHIQEYVVSPINEYAGTGKSKTWQEVTSNGGVDVAVARGQNSKQSAEVVSVPDRNNLSVTASLKY